jgi:riboflavin biosynthesis pyrimidine reductase
VLVGAGTLRTERYGRLIRDPRRREQRVAAGLRPDPVAIVVSGRLDLSPDIPLLADLDSTVVVVTASAASLDGCAARIAYVRSSPVELGAALAQIRAEHGVRSILCEGGPALNASLVTAGLIDELFLTTVPKIAGGAGALTIVGAAAIEQPVAARLQWLLECDGELFARYRLGA